MPSRCFSFTSQRDRCYRRLFSSAGLHPISLSVPSIHTTTLLWWVPLRPKPDLPYLLLLHGFGANARWQWGPHLSPLLPSFNLLVPDLLFFGASSSSLPDRSAPFQARCLASSLPLLAVDRASVVGVSYGGFVAYRLAAEFPEIVERVALCCAGVCLEERDLREGMFVVDDVDAAADILLPRTPRKLRELLKLSFVKPWRGVPSCFLRDYIDVMCTDHVEEKKELIHALIKDRKLSNLPKITQQTLIIWGEQDQIFPLELGHRLNRHLEGNSQLVVIKDAGHAVNLEKPKEFMKHLKPFLLDSPTNLNTNRKCNPKSLTSDRPKWHRGSCSLSNAFSKWRFWPYWWSKKNFLPVSIYDKIEK